MKLITNQSSVKITLCGPQTSHGRTGFSACYSGMCFQILIGFLGEYIRWNSHWPCLAFFAGTLVVAAIVESVDGFRTRQNFESILRLVCFVILCAKRNYKNNNCCLLSSCRTESYKVFSKASRADLVNIRKL